MKLFAYMRPAVCALCLLALSALPAAAQQTPPPVVPTAPVIEPDDSTEHRGLNPRSAFIRSLIVPGWGQFSVGAPRRGAVFVALQGASWYMLVKTINKLGDVQDRESGRIDFVTDSLRTRMQTDTVLARQLADPDDFDARVESDSALISIQSLVSSREEQRQDWIAYTIAVTLMSAVDAYVAAHLADFPATITTRPRADGALQLKVSVPAQRRP